LPAGHLVDKVEADNMAAENMLVGKHHSDVEGLAPIGLDL